MGDDKSPFGRAPPPIVTMQRTLFESFTRTLSSMDRAILDAPITSAGLAALISHLHASSAPDMDEMTAGFYQVAPDVFRECLSNVFHDSLQRVHLLASQRKSAREPFWCPRFGR